MHTFGERLSYLRNKKEISQEELAKYLKIGKSTLGMYETNKREPGHETTARIAEYFEVSIDWLTTGREFKYSTLPSNQTEFVLKEISEKYAIDLEDPDSKERLEKIIQLVFGDMKQR